MSKSNQSKKIDYLSDDDDLEVYNNSDIESDIENEESNLPTFKKDKTNKLKMVRINGQWMVDLKYTFSGNL